MALEPRTVENMPDCLQGETNQGLASGFDDPGSSEQMVAAEFRIADAPGVAAKVFPLGAKLFRHFGRGGLDGS